jgi:membrane protein
VVGKMRDLLSLVVLGLGLLLSVAVTGLVVGFSDRVLDLLGLGHQLSWCVTLLGLVLGVLANMLLFYVFFRLLAQPPVPHRALWHGALVGGVAFEILKQVSSYLLTATRSSPAFQAFGIALILLVWINYFSRIVMYAAAWAYTSAPARATRANEPASPLPVVPEPRLEASAAPSAGGSADPRLAFGAGVATALGLVALARRRRR